MEKNCLVNLGNIINSKSINIEVINKYMNIKEQIEKSDIVIIFDTCVYLNIYKYSPEYSDFALECIKSIDEYLTMPSTVNYEYSKHYLQEFNRMKNRINEAGKETYKQINNATNKIINSCNNFVRLQFQDSELLINELENKLNDISEYFNNFYINKRYPQKLNSIWNTDKVYELVEGIYKLPDLTQQEIYEWCEEAVNRYERKIPPGYMDEKDKDGIRKYSDLFIWKEIINYARDIKKDVIFVTDDLKEDWWEINNKIEFRKELIDEFNEKTGMSIEAYKASDFYEEISKIFYIHKETPIETMLNYTDSYYMDSIYDSVFYEASDKLDYCINDYVDNQSIKDIGDQGLFDCYIDDWELSSHERIDNGENLARYEFIYDIKLLATSNNYWGKDDDTHEPILSPDIDLVLEGTLTVQVIRNINILMDFNESNDYSSITIKNVELKETSYFDHNEDYDVD